MGKASDRRFDHLVEQFIEDMEAVDCSMEDFVDALKDAGDRIAERRAISKAELGDDS